MIFFKMPKLAIGNTIARLPIVQGGMGVGISLAGLASAVANEGGIGVIAANAIGMIEPDYYTNGREANIRALRQQIQKARQQTKGMIGVNIMVALNDFQDMLAVAVSEKVDAVFLGAGLPIRQIPVAGIRGADVKVIPIVSSRRAAELIFRYWDKNYGDIPDAVVVEGPLAGGHLGFAAEQLQDPEQALEKLVPGVVSALAPFEKKFGRSIPVIAAGGIFSGDDIYRFLKLGAQAVQMATRFVATWECDADMRFKQAYLDCKKEDIVIIKSPVGMPGRAIRNQFLDDAAAGIRNTDRCAWRCLESCEIKNSVYCISAALDHARKGELDKGFAFVGANAFRVNRITSVRVLLNSLKSEYEAALIKGLGTLKTEYLKMIEEGFGHLQREYQRARERVIAVGEKYGKVLEKKVDRVKTEMDKALARVNALRKEYELGFEKLNGLKRLFPEKLKELKAIAQKFREDLDSSCPSLRFSKYRS